MQLRLGCCQYVKDKNFESNSQPEFNVYMLPIAVVSMSKIKISKAIHNINFHWSSRHTAVVSMSKIKISKAIHNVAIHLLLYTTAVVSMSKIKISKAIHNTSRKHPKYEMAVVSMSKIKISKAIHNAVSPGVVICKLLSVCQR